MLEINELRSRKKMNLPEAERRTHCVSCRLNPVELSILDDFRGGHQRGEALRMLALGELPAPVPFLNRQAWQELSKVGSNLNQIAHRLNSSENVNIEEIRDALESFRYSLLGAAI